MLSKGAYAGRPICAPSELTPASQPSRKNQSRQRLRLAQDDCIRDDCALFCELFCNKNEARIFDEFESIFDESELFWPYLEKIDMFQLLVYFIYLLVYLRI